METLYLKYRPQSFDEIIGQEHIKKTLQNEIRLKAISHAFLFTGPRGTGKTSIARIMAKTLNCQQRGEGETAPCLSCQSCLEIKQNKSLDVIEIDAASNTGVDNVRENIIDNARFTPFRDQYKVFIIDEVHMLSISAFNALLKVIEEPPQHVIFVLCTTELHKIPDTIISRCQRFDFKKINLDILATHLVSISSKENVQLAPQVASDIALLSGGFVRDALSTLSQVLSLGKKEITTEDAVTILPRNNKIKNQELVSLLQADKTREAILLVDSLVEDGVDLEQFTLNLVEYLRDLIMLKHDIKVFNDDKETKDQAQKTDLESLLKYLNKFIEKIPQLKRADISQLPLEIACIELTSRQNNSTNTPPVEPLPTIEKQPVQIEKKETEIKEDKPEISEVVEEKPKKQTIKDLLQKQDKLKKTSDQEVEIKKEDKTTQKIKVKYDEIKDRWSEIVEKSSEVNHSLKVALGVAFPLDLEKNKLKIGFEHEFYCDRYKDIGSRKMIEQVLQNIFGCQILVECKMLTAEERQKVREEKNILKEKDDQQAEDLALSFGGTIVQ
jgi:DNA polymerase III subunit gamma/tau